MRRSDYVYFETHFRINQQDMPLSWVKAEDCKLQDSVVPRRVALVACFIGDRSRVYLHRGCISVRSRRLSTHREHDKTNSRSYKGAQPDSKPLTPSALLFYCRCSAEVHRKADVSLRR